MKFANVFGIKFNSISLEDLGKNVISGDLAGKIIVTPNVDHIVRFHRDEDFRVTYQKADVFVNDSRILRLLSRLGLQKLQFLVPGSDLTAWIFQRLPSDASVMVIGCSEDTIATITVKYKPQRIYHYNPPMGFIKDPGEVEKCVEFCLSNPADIIFFAVGSPQQEVIANAVKNKGSKAVLLCIGASLLFLSGEEVRAPLWVQNFHLEWLFRLLQNPRKMYKRYLVDGVKIFPIFLKERFK